MAISVHEVQAALDLPNSGLRSDFDLNPEVRASQMGMHERLPAAVLCALRSQDGVLHVVLTERAAHLRRHAGQIAFPGGRIDDTDPSPEDAALREAEEEVGLKPSAVRVLGRLDPYLTSTGFHVTPVIGIINGHWHPSPDPAEVESVFEPPLDFLMDPQNHQRHYHDRNGYRRYYFAMPWNGHYIWGATAGMLKGLSDRLSAVRR
ncbi:MAG: CoA pyrophosphatase [Pseudomonadota bacterium]